jgi:hypothetical protein
MLHTRMGMTLGLTPITRVRMFTGNKALRTLQPMGDEITKNWRELQ